MSHDLPVEPAYDFWNKQLDFLGDRHPTDVLNETPERLAGLITSHGPRAMQAHAIEGKWSPAEILGHLLDIEWVIGFRARTIFCDDHPTLMPMEQDLWVTRQLYCERPANETLELFRCVRRATVDFWKRLPSEALSRTGHHEEARMEISLDLFRSIQAGHDLYHLDQMERYLTITADRS